MVMMQHLVLKNKLQIFWGIFIFLFGISFPSLLSVHVKGRESFGIVLLTEKYKQEHRCLTNALFAEARGEPEEGIRAVMTVIYNRKNHKNYPDTFCGVILQPMQFSAFNSDKSLATKGLKPVRELDKKAHVMVAYIANEAVLGAFRPTVEPSVLWYTKTGLRNKWTIKKKVVKIVSSHQFYKEI